MDKKLKNNSEKLLKHKGILKYSVQKPPVKKPKSTGKSGENEKKQQGMKAQY